MKMKLFTATLMLFAAAIGLYKTAFNYETALSSSSDPAGQAQQFINVDGPDLKSRMEAAIKLGRSQQKRFWTAYAFDVGPGIGIDVLIYNSGGSVIYDSRMITGSGGRYETRNVGVFLLHEKDGSSVVRAELYNLERSRDYSGYQVYWLGRGGNQESLNFLKGMVETARSVDVADNLTDAIGAHDDMRVEAILKDFIRNSSVERVRTTAVSWLGHIPGQTHFLAGLVRDERESVEVRKEAADAMGDSPDTEAMPTLQNLYSSVSHREVRAEILDSISDSENNEAAVNFLIRVAKNEPDDELRREAIEGLGERKDPRALQTLQEIVNDSSADTDIQRTAVEAIDERAESEAAPLLIKIAKTHPKMDVRKEAIERLGEFPGQMPFLIELARNDSESSEVRREAISAIAESRNAGTVSTLKSLYSASASREIKEEIINAIEDSEERNAGIDFLLEIARSDSDREMRERAFSALGDIGEDRAIEALAQLYDSESSEHMKEEILSALADSDNDRAWKKLIQVARSDPSMKLKKRAISLIGESDHPEAARFLEGIIK